MTKFALYSFISSIHGKDFRKIFLSHRHPKLQQLEAKMAFFSPLSNGTTTTTRKELTVLLFCANPLSSYTLFSGKKKYPSKKVKKNDILNNYVVSSILSECVSERKRGNKNGIVYSTTRVGGQRIQQLRGRLLFLISAAHFTPP